MKSPTRSSPKAKTKKSAHENHFHYEFGGPVGAFFTMTSLPIVVYGLYFLCKGRCDSDDGFCLSTENLDEVLDQIPQDLVEVLWSTKAFSIVLGWIGFHVVLERCLPGEMADGVELSNKTRLKYPLNGHLAFWVSMMALLFFPIDLFCGSPVEASATLDLSYAYDGYAQLATASLVVAVALSAYLYARSFAKGALLAPHGDSGNPIYDLFIGRELNPRLLGGTFDLKYFFELRPGLIGWVAINAGCLVKHAQLHGGSVSGAMILVNVFQGLYVWDALYNERAILTTMDIINDGFGYMLAFGDICWVPFTYSLQARYLVENDGVTDPLGLAAIAALNVLGYWIFRGSNGQKDAFRRDPNDPALSHLETLTTKRGRKLIVSGWWGMARKINYTGDWIMGLSWCLFTGFNSIVPYFYAIYFCILLVHRAFRDNDQCAAKYGSDWPKYKAKVPYVFVPGLI